MNIKAVLILGLGIFHLEFPFSQQDTTKRKELLISLQHLNLC